MSNSFRYSTRLWLLVVHCRMVMARRALRHCHAWRFRGSTSSDWVRETCRVQAAIHLQTLINCFCLLLSSHGGSSASEHGPSCSTRCPGTSPPGVGIEMAIVGSSLGYSDVCPSALTALTSAARMRPPRPPCTRAVTSEVGRLMSTRPATKETYLSRPSVNMGPVVAPSRGLGMGPRWPGRSDVLDHGRGVQAAVKVRRQDRVAQVAARRT